MRKLGRLHVIHFDGFRHSKGTSAMRCQLVLLGSLLTGLAAADPLTITISGTGSGTLGGKTFSVTAFTITLTTDTKLVVKPPCCDTRDTPAGTTATFSIAGVG